MCVFHATSPYSKKKRKEKKSLNIYYFCPISSDGIDPANQSYLERWRWRECKEINQNIAGRPLIIISIHRDWLVIWFGEEKEKNTIFLCPQIRRKNNQKRLVNHSSNEKPIDSDFSSLLCFYSLCFPLQWGESVFRIDFIIWEALSVRGRWFGLADTTPMPSKLKIKRSHWRRRTLQFFIKVYGQLWTPAAESYGG